MNKSFLLLVSLMAGVLEAARPGEEEEYYENGSGGAQAARDLARAQEEEQRAQRERSQEQSRKRGGWSRGRAGFDAKQPVEQGGQQRDDGQEQGHTTVTSKRPGDDDGAQANALARAARGDEGDLFGNLGETNASTTKTASGAAPKVTVEDVARVINEGKDAVINTANNFITAGSRKWDDMQHQADELVAATTRFERTGKVSTLLSRTAQDASKVTTIIGNRDVNAIDVSQVSNGIKISAGGKFATVKEIIMSFVPKNIFKKILFCWNRYKMKKKV